MCGLFSAVNNAGLSLSQPAYLNALRTLSHRGPDDEGAYSDGKVYLGHRRLSIIDTSSAGHQPMADLDGQVQIVFNGQIYNYKALRKTLEGKGHRFRSECDTEVLLKAYIEYGTSCFELFVGMWALVIYDKRSNTIVTSRDRLGIKPLFCYRTEAGEQVFASEIKAILAAYPESAKENPIATYRFITRGWMELGDNTMFRDILQHPRGTYKIWRMSQLEKTVKFWDFPEPTDTLIDPVHARDVFTQAVDDHLVSDVPIATTLSGGIDSTSINCVVAKQLNRGNEINAFSLVAPKSANESQWIDDTVKYLNINHEYLYIDQIDESAELEKLTDNMDEPIFSVPFLYQSLLREKVSEKGYKVLLIGDGGDEIFGGYAKVHPIFVLSLLQSGNLDAAKKAIKGGADFSQRTIEDQFDRLKLLRDKGIGKRTVQEFSRGYDLFHKDFSFSEAEAFPDFHFSQLDRLEEGAPFFQEVLERFHLDTPYHLRIEDRIAMRYGIEARPVFLDHRFVECAWKYHYSHFMRNGVSKSLMRDAMAGILTPSVIENKKKFVRPGNDSVYIYDQVASEIRDMLASESVKTSGIWPENAAQLFEKDLADRNPDSAFPWFRFYSYQKWHKAKIASNR